MGDDALSGPLVAAVRDRFVAVNGDHPMTDGDDAYVREHFVEATPEEALAMAAEAAGGLDVRLGGGVETVRTFLDADLVDELHDVVVPIVLGRGQRFDIEVLPGGSGVTHLLLTRRA